MEGSSIFFEDLGWLIMKNPKCKERSNLLVNNRWNHTHSEMEEQFRFQFFIRPALKQMHIFQDSLSLWDVCTFWCQKLNLQICGNREPPLKQFWWLLPCSKETALFKPQRCTGPQPFTISATQCIRTHHAMVMRHPNRLRTHAVGIFGDFCQNKSFHVPLSHYTY